MRLAGAFFAWGDLGLMGDGRVRLVIVTNGYPAHEEDYTAGFVQTLARTLVERGWAVTVLSIRTTRDRVESPDLTIRSLGADALFRGYWRRPFGFWRDVRALVERAETEVLGSAYDLILAAWAFPAGYVARALSARRSGPPYGVWCLGDDIWRARYNPVYRRVLRPVLRGAALLMADASSLAREITHMCGRSNVHLCPALVPAPAGGAPVQGLRNSEIAFVGRYERNKGPDVLAQALSILQREQGVEMACTFYGAGGLEPMLVKRTAGLRRVSVKGPLLRTELFEVLACISALVIPSRRESLPAVLYDAMQAGTPVVVSDAGDMESLAAQWYVPTSCWVFPSGDAKALAAQLYRIRAITRDEPGRCSLKRPFDPGVYLHEAMEPLQRIMLQPRAQRGSC